ncbi:C3HC4-type zinc finger protein [Phanerochaete sordida]|uniref:C3HC4-type zinc finger protein n=1 Tax=Phanerochaete sordida TaxID=48140 RepID=A0A9P3FYM3_9APHY|nr:C3HC4-type zinc finger protein [Phanerochaete sordida]
MAAPAHDDDLDTVLALTPEQRVERAVQALPTLAAHDVPADDSCPICLLPFASVLGGENVGPGHSRELAGVTKLAGCGHVFCRLDLIEWIRGRHGTCPACRHTFLDVQPVSESDGESSDGDYVPDYDDWDDDEDVDFSTDEGSDFAVDPFEAEHEPDAWDFDAGLMDGLEREAWRPSSQFDPLENWGLSDGDSLSEGDRTMSADEALEVDAMIDADVRVQEEESDVVLSDAEASK